jgi:hypothetical protein
VGIILKVISAVYLLLHWAVFIGAFQKIEPSTPYTSDFGAQLLLVAIAVALSIPAIALYAFGQLVDDFRAVRTHLQAAR